MHIDKKAKFRLEAAHKKKLNKFSIHDDCIQRNQPTAKNAVDKEVEKME